MRYIFLCLLLFCCFILYKAEKKIGKVLVNYLAGSTGLWGEWMCSLHVKPLCGAAFSAFRPQGRDKGLPRNSPGAFRSRVNPEAWSSQGDVASADPEVYSGTGSPGSRLATAPSPLRSRIRFSKGPGWAHHLPCPVLRQMCG